jgi:hypothetical protein
MRHGLFHGFLLNVRLAFLLGMIVFKKNLGLSFNKGHGVYIVVNLHHRDVLPWVLFRNASIANQELVFVMVPVKNFGR